MENFISPLAVRFDRLICHSTLRVVSCVWVLLTKHILQYLLQGIYAMMILLHHFSMMLDTMFFICKMYALGIINKWWNMILEMLSVS